MTLKHSQFDNAIPTPGLPIDDLEKMLNAFYFAQPTSETENLVDFAHRQSGAHPQALSYAEQWQAANAGLKTNTTSQLDSGPSVSPSAAIAETSDFTRTRHLPKTPAIPNTPSLAQATEIPGVYQPIKSLDLILADQSNDLSLTDPARKYSPPSILSLAESPPASSLYFINELQPFRNESSALTIVNRYPPFDVHAVRRDFPILNERVNGRPLIWLDNAATTQKPQVVIDRLSDFYRHENSNIHRAAHELAARATDAYEDARNTVARYLHASTSDEIVFLRGTTEAINLVAQSWGRRNIGKDDEIVISWLEHHANIVPWQQLCRETGAVLRVAPVDDNGQILLDEYEKLFNLKTKLAAFTHVSNALGTVAPVKEMIEIAHRYGVRVLVDGAQSISHMRIDVQDLDCDWFVFSGHKIFGPTGIGVLYGKLELLNSMPPWQGGGNMIQDVTFEKTTYQAAPNRFEAGTGNIADAVGLGAALEYVENVGIENISRYEHELLVYATEGLACIPGLRLIGTASDKASVLSFVLDGYKSEEVGEILNKQGIAVRSGHHCAQPILRRFGVETSVRPSLAFYNTFAEIDALISTLRNIRMKSIPTLRE